MAERRYSLRFSLPDGFLFVVSLLVTSSLIFLFGVYVGKAGEMRKLVQPVPIVRVPVALAKEPTAPARPRVEPPVLASVPAEKEPPEHIIPMLDAAPEEEPAKKPAATPQPTKASKKAKPVLKEQLPSATRKSSPPLPTKASITTARDKRPEQKISSPPTKAAVTTATESRRISPPPPSPPLKATSQPAPARWSVQVDETGSRAAAQDTIRILRAQGHDPVMVKVIKGGEVRYRIRVGNFSNQQEAVGAVVSFRRGKFSKATMVSE